LFAALDLWGMHRLAIPYYTGIIRHTPSGGLGGLQLHAINFTLVFQRLAAFKLSAPLIALWWVLYLAATFALTAIGLRTSRR
jgi:hypothetical protein